MNVQDSRTKPSESARYGASFPRRGVGISKSVYWRKTSTFHVSAAKKMSCFYRGAHASLVTGG